MSHVLCLAWTVLSQGAGDEAVATALRLLDRDPPIAKVQEAALDHFKVATADLSGYRAAARLKALLPAVTGSYTQDDNKVSVVNISQPTDVTVTDDTNGLGRAFSASVTWDLSSLIFDASELEAYALVGIHEDVVQEVTRLYYTRQHNLLSLALDPPSDVRARAGLILRTREAEAMLDAMTGGEWSRLKTGGR